MSLEKFQGFQNIPPEFEENRKAFEEAREEHEKDKALEKMARTKDTEGIIEAVGGMNPQGLANLDTMIKSKESEFAKLSLDKSKKYETDRATFILEGLIAARREMEKNPEATAA